MREVEIPSRFWDSMEILKIHKKKSKEAII